MGDYNEYLKVYLHNNRDRILKMDPGRARAEFNTLMDESNHTYIECFNQMRRAELRMMKVWAISSIRCKPEDNAELEKKFIKVYDIFNGTAFFKGIMSEFEKFADKLHDLRKKTREYMSRRNP